MFLKYVLQMHTKNVRTFDQLWRSKVTYTQGQSPKKRVREYFYYIDHQGQLFLDDARIKNFTSCFKEIKFLTFFFKHLKVNKSDRYPMFPFISHCGIERNYVRCDDVPIVFTHLIPSEEPSEGNPTLICYNNAKHFLKDVFDPSKISMEIETGRVYYPTSDQYGKVGLMRSQLAIQLSNSFCFEAGEERPPTHIVWEGSQVELTHECLVDLEKLKDVRRFSLGLDSD